MREAVDRATSLISAQDELDDELCTWPSAPALYTRANAVDQWPRPITPLTQDLIAYPQERGLGRAFGPELGTAPEGGPWTWNGVFYGWYVYGVGPAAEMADRLPGYSRVAVYSDYFGVEQDPAAPVLPSGGAGPLAMARIGRNFLRAMRTYPRRAERMTELARVRLAADLRRDWASEPAEALVARLRAHLTEGVDFRVPHVLASVISAPLFQNVTEAARRILPEEADRLVIEAVSGLGGIHLREATRAMGEVARGTLDRERFLDEYGFRGANEFELAALPWRDDPATVDRLISGAAQDRPAPTGTREHARARLRAAAGLRWPALRWKLRLLETHLRWRENGKVPMAMATHSLRLLVREGGRRLVESGRLAQPDDVYYLRLSELVCELSGRPEADLAVPPVRGAAALGADLRASVARRRRTLECSARLRIPEMLDVEPGRLAEIGPARWKEMGVLPPKPAETAPSGAGAGAGVAALTGVGGSPGVATGRARIVHDPNEVELAEGDVIVARGTDSAWTPLFFEAAAVVIDVGGAMSHSAIAAREVGIPCVVNVKTGTEHIAEGQRVTVDGGAGTVQLH
ncbi:MAG TPA: PEP-utilizing enzyme [Pseudonocardia sp.]|jgi:pyruvate,water dikinase|nr:PEP-utilizing enzyme [Pseudonocardia sp.]